MSNKRVLIVNGEPIEHLVCILDYVDVNGSASPQKDGGQTDSSLYGCLWLEKDKKTIRTITSGTPYGMMLAGLKPINPVIFDPKAKTVFGDNVLVNQNGKWNIVKCEEGISFNEIFKVIFTPEDLWRIPCYELRSGKLITTPTYSVKEQMVFGKAKLGENIFVDIKNSRILIETEEKLYNGVEVEKILKKFHKKLLEDLRIQKEGIKTWLIDTGIIDE